MKIDLYHSYERPWLVKDDETRKYTEKIRRIIGPNYFFLKNQKDKRYEFWEHRGPLTTMVFPLTISGQAFDHIGDWNLRNCLSFIRRSRTPEKQERFFKEKQYERFTDPDSYKPPKEDNSNWEDSSPKPKYKKKKVNVSNLTQVD